MTSSKRWDLRFSAMGTYVHVLVAGNPELLPGICNDITRLESLWSRFIEASEISRLNAASGAPVSVSKETIDLLQRSREGWEITGGLFDPTLLNELVAAGYDRDFDQLLSEGCGSATDVTGRELESFPLSINSAESTANVAPGFGFDSGGIGKGLAADIVAENLLGQGASSALINLGGDLRVVGSPPEGGWIVDLDNPFNVAGEPAARVALSAGALATSTSRSRRWTQDGVERHHLIDPATGQPAATDVASVTVIDEFGWRAEVLTKGAFIAGVEKGLSLIHSKGATGLIVNWDGQVHLVPGVEQHLLDGALPRLNLRKAESAKRVTIRIPDLSS